MKVIILITYHNENQFAVFLMNNELPKQLFKHIRGPHQLEGRHNQTLFVLPGSYERFETQQAIIFWRQRGNKVSEISEDVVLGRKPFLI